MFAYWQANKAMEMKRRRARGMIFESIYHTSKNSIAYAFIEKHKVLNFAYLATFGENETFLDHSKQTNLEGGPVNIHYLADSIVYVEDQ